MEKITFTSALYCATVLQVKLVTINSKKKGVSNNVLKNLLYRAAL